MRSTSLGKRRKTKLHHKGKNKWYDVQNNSILLYYFSSHVYLSPCILLSCKIQQVGEETSNDGVQERVVGDDASEYFSLQGPITDDLDGELSVKDKEKIGLLGIRRSIRFFSDCLSKIGLTQEIF